MRILICILYYVYFDFQMTFKLHDLQVTAHEIISRILSLNSDMNHLK